ncbi:hypothetical protein K6106_00075 [Pseudomonas fluorescens]|nr:hypothetical protein K6106_00075 [Pseudomonas fluorescens]
MNTLFTQSLDIRVAYAKAEIYGDEITQYEAEIEAHILGADAYRAGQPIVPELFKTVPALSRAWGEGVNAAINGGGWSRFTEEDQQQLITRNHTLCRILHTGNLHSPSAVSSTPPNTEERCGLLHWYR